MYLIQEEKKKKREREQSENTASAPVEPFTLPKPVEVKPSKACVMMMIQRIIS